MKQVELIIFDLDGTLVDSRKDIAKAVNFTLQELGLKEKSISEINSYIGTGVNDLIGKSLGPGQGDIFNKALALFEGYHREHLTDDSRLYPGVKEILEHFRDKNKVIITNRRYEFALVVLKALGVRDYFDDILGGDNLDCVKPSSCPLERAMNNLQVDRAKTIIVGDMDIDVRAGKKAEILTCAVTYGIGSTEDV